MTTELPEKPLSRKESYLAKIAGQSVEIPEKPESRIEQYLAYIAENGGGGGGGIPTTVIDTIWFGTQEQYEAIDPKAEKTLYLVQEEVEAVNTLNAPSVVLTPKLDLNRENVVVEETLDKIEETEDELEDVKKAVEYLENEEIPEDNTEEE